MVYAVSICLAVILCGYGSLAVWKADVYTTYVNGHGEVLATPQDGMIFRAPTCTRYDSGFDVTVKMFHPHNPSNEPNLGRTYFTISNKLYANGIVPAADQICTMQYTNATYLPTCTGLAGKGDIYVYVKGNNNRFINFAIEVTFKPRQPDYGVIENGVTGPFYFPASYSQEDLVPVFQYDRVLELPYLNETLFHLQVCVDRKFVLTTVFQAADVHAKSTLTQAVCLSLPCDMNTGNRVGDNIDALPVNMVTTSTIDAKDIYVYGVAYNGPLDNGYPNGQFRFAAEVEVK